MLLRTKRHLRRYNFLKIGNLIDPIIPIHISKESLKNSERARGWTLPVVFVLWLPVTEGNNRERNGDVESSAHKHKGRRIHQYYVASPALGFRARIRSSPHSPGTPLLPSPLSESVYPLLHFCVGSWNLLAAVYSLIISFYSSYSCYGNRYCFEIKFKFLDTEYNEGFLMADKHGGGGCCFSAS